MCLLSLSFATASVTLDYNENVSIGNEFTIETSGVFEDLTAYESIFEYNSLEVEFVSYDISNIIIESNLFIPINEENKTGITVASINGSNTGEGSLGTFTFKLLTNSTTIIPKLDLINSTFNSNIISLENILINPQEISNITDPINQTQNDTNNQTFK